MTLDKDCSRVNAGSPFYRSSDRDSSKIVTLVNREHDATYLRSLLPSQSLLSFVMKCDEKKKKNINH